MHVHDQQRHTCCRLSRRRLRHLSECGKYGAVRISSVFKASDV
jgi:hypothetical protein